MHSKPPFTKPKERHGRMSRYMTLVIGMECHDCLLFCADREEYTEYGGKRSVSKIHEAIGRNWMMGIATSGSGPLGDVAALKIISEARKYEDFSDTPTPLLERVLLRIYKRYVFPRDERRQMERGISLVIGILNSETGEKFLFKTFEEIVKPQPHYACAGAGQEIAHYFLGRLYGDGLKGSEALVLNAFVVREAKASVGGVGRESEFVKFIRDIDGHHVTTRTLTSDDVWNRLPHLSHCLSPFWKESKPSGAQTSEQEP